MPSSTAPVPDSMETPEKEQQASLAQVRSAVPPEGHLVQTRRPGEDNASIIFRRPLAALVARMSAHWLG